MLQVLPNGTYYKASSFEAFREHVCWRIACVSDCCILQVAFLEPEFNALFGYRTIRMVESNEEEKDANPPHRAKGVKVDLEEAGIDDCDHEE